MGYGVRSMDFLFAFVFLCKEEGVGRLANPFGEEERNCIRLSLALKDFENGSARR